VVHAETVPLNLIPSDGQVTDGRYFLWSKTNGGYVEVTRSFWEWIRFHNTSTFATWPLVMLAGGYLVFAELGSKVRGGISPIVASARVRQVRGSGPLLAWTRSAGLIGGTWFSRPLVRIQVYPAGIVVKPLFIAEGAVLAGEITAVTPKGGLSARSVADRSPVLGFGVSEVSPSYQPRGQFVEVEHTGVGIASPLMIVGSGNWDIAQAISRVADGARARSADGLMPAPETPMPSATIEANDMMQVEPAQGNRRQQLPSPIRIGGAILGIIVSLTMVWLGITWVIPQLGLFGVAWTAFLIFILAVNTRRFLVRRRDS